MGRGRAAFRNFIFRKLDLTLSVQHGHCKQAYARRKVVRHPRRFQLGLHRKEDKRESCDRNNYNKIEILTNSEVLFWGWHAGFLQVEGP